MSLFLRQILALLFAAVIVASASFSSDAAPAAPKRTANFDGLWSVAIALVGQIRRIEEGSVSGSS